MNKYQQLKQKIITFISIIVILQLSWMGLEQLLYGEVQPRIVDDIIGIGFYISIWINVSWYYKYKAAKEAFKGYTKLFNKERSWGK